MAIIKVGEATIKAWVNFNGTKGNWTIQEGENDLYILNNKSGKKYKFKLEEM